jgi:PHD/YefM family antitoxin component YafN of YafNO toxin-antitoxin module
MTLHTQIIEKEGKEFVMLPADEFAILKDTLEDYEDLKALREEKAASGSEATKSLDSIIKEVEQG